MRRILSFSFFWFIAAAPPAWAMDIDFARNLASKAIEGSYEEVGYQITSLNTIELEELKALLMEVIAQDPPLTTSIADTWLIYGIIYDIDDILGTLEYSTILEGAFDWNSATSMLGATNLEFITDRGLQIPIFTTVATVDKESVYLNSAGRKVRLYINEEILSDGRKRNHVVKMEPLY